MKRNDILLQQLLDISADLTKANETPERIALGKYVIMTTAAIAAVMETDTESLSSKEKENEAISKVIPGSVMMMSCLSEIVKLTERLMILQKKIADIQQGPINPFQTPPARTA